MTKNEIDRASKTIEISNKREQLMGMLCGCKKETVVEFNKLLEDYGKLYHERELLRFDGKVWGVES